MKPRRRTLKIVLLLMAAALALVALLAVWVYVVPSRKLVVVRLGEQARGWDDAYLVNAVPPGMEADR